MDDNHRQFFDSHLRRMEEDRQRFESLHRANEFTVTEDHIKLLRHARANEWNPGEYYGAAGINAKRPYGDSYIARSIAEILDAPDEDWEFEDGEKAYPTDEAEERFMRLHIEAMAALQIVLAVGEFRPGRYRRIGEWGNDWQHDDSGG